MDQQKNNPDRKTYSQNTHNKPAFQIHFDVINHQ